MSMCFVEVLMVDNFLLFSEKLLENDSKSNLYFCLKTLKLIYLNRHKIIWITPCPSCQATYKIILVPAVDIQ